MDIYALAQRRGTMRNCVLSTTCPHSPLHSSTMVAKSIVKPICAWYFFDPVPSPISESYVALYCSCLAIWLLIPTVMSTQWPRYTSILVCSTMCFLDLETTLPSTDLIGLLGVQIRVCWPAIKAYQQEIIVVYSVEFSCFIALYLLPNIWVKQTESNRCWVKLPRLQPNVILYMHACKCVSIPVSPVLLHWTEMLKPHATISKMLHIRKSGN